MEREISITIAKKAHCVDRGVNNVIIRDDYNKILDYPTQNISESGYAVKLQDFLGVRVEEVARISRENINLEDKTIKFVNTKGERELTRDISNDKIELIKEVLEHNYHADRLLSIQGDSINRYLNRIEYCIIMIMYSLYDILKKGGKKYIDNISSIAYPFRDIFIPIN